MKPIDPIERALDAYFELDTDQKATFAIVLKHIDRVAEMLGHSVDYCKPQDETKPTRGRPKGSKNRKLSESASPLSPENFEPSALFAANGAPEVDL